MTIATREKQTKRTTSGPSKEKRDWVTQLGKHGRMASGGGGQNLAEAAPAREGDALEGGIGGLFPIPVDPEALRIRATIRIHNRTDHMLELVPGSAKLHRPLLSQFNTEPPVDIAPKENPEIVVTNKLPFISGVSGEVTYAVRGDKNDTKVIFRWTRRRAPRRKAEIDIVPEDRDRFIGTAGFDKDTFTFKFESREQPTDDPKDGPTDDPTDQPKDDPTPTPVTPVAPDIASSCLITVNNNTEHVLTLTDQGHERGDFMTFPAATLQPGASTQFVSLETPNAADHGCAGFLTWQVGNPMAAVWRIEWDNPEQQKNTAASSINPESAGFAALEQVGQGEENVPVVFTISGGSAPTPVPCHDDPPPTDDPTPCDDPDPAPPAPEVDFRPPPESAQPTLRKGDKSPDGWVEYLQFMLNQYSNHTGMTLAEDGDFGSKTYAAVRKFQDKSGCVVDGIVGDQTWAALRGAPPEDPSTDGRAPHSYVEQGAEARWDYENDFNNRYSPDEDRLWLAVTSLGDQPIDAYKATVRITPPDTAAKTIEIAIGTPEKERATGSGHLHRITLENFRERFPSTDPEAPVEQYLIEAYLPGELGGDLYSGNVVSY